MQPLTPFIHVLSFPATRRGRAGVLGGGVALTLVALLLWTHPLQRRDPTPQGTLLAGSQPPGAMVAVDGQVLGQTPVRLRLAPGVHQVNLRHEGNVIASYPVTITAEQTTTLQAELWSLTPQVLRLRPIFPGATIAEASFLRDGHAVLIVVLPPDGERQVWRLDRMGDLQRMPAPEIVGPLAVAPDGDRIAYLVPGRAAPSGQPSFREMRIVTAEGAPVLRRYRLPEADKESILMDLTWAPDGQHLLVVQRQDLSGGSRTDLLWMEAAGGESRDLVRLPSEIIPDSFAWSPDARQVAFLARAGQTVSLCLLGIDEGDFHYLADLGRERSALPFPPITWSPDGARLVYAAPPEDPSALSGWLFTSSPAPALFAADGAGLGSQRMGTAEGDYPVWSTQAGLLALAPPREGAPLTLRAVSTEGIPRDLAELPLRPASAYAVRWDVAHAQALVAVRTSSGLGAETADYWLIRFRPEGDR